MVFGTISYGNIPAKRFKNAQLFSWKIYPIIYVLRQINRRASFKSISEMQTDISLYFRFLSMFKKIIDKLTEKTF